MNFMTFCAEESVEMAGNVLVILGIAVFCGMIGALVFQKLKFPQVVGNIIIGLLLGESVFGLISQTDILKLQNFNMFALGVIGFLVGGELKIETFKKYAKQFISILCFEGMFCFFMVGITTGLLVFGVCRQVIPSLAVGLVFGAISSATDPASTIDVIWEYRAKGIMTTAIIAVVALDDALAMTLWGISTGILQIFGSGNISDSILHELLMVAVHIFGSLLIGGIFAGILALFFRFLHQVERAAAISVGVILLIIGCAIYLHLDVILASMTAGFILANAVPRRSEQLFKLLRSFSIPIYVTFFVLVGARLALNKMPIWLWGFVFLYVFFRSLGKVSGSYIGAKIAGSPANVRKYLGYGIFAQGGVAIGLAIIASEKLRNVKIADNVDLTMGDMVVFVVTSTTLILQITGPAMVKFALKRSGEAGKNITEEDVVATMHVMDVIDDKLITIDQSAPVSQAVEYFTRNDALFYPVLDRKKHICGILTFESLKDIMGDRDSWQWLLVDDVMLPVIDSTTPGEQLKNVYDKMLQLKIDQMPVLDNSDSKKVLGMLDIRNIRQKVQAELLRRSN